MLELPQNLLPHGGTLYYFPGFLSAREASEYFTALNNSIHWQQYTIRIFGKAVLQPRLSAWHGDKGYAYSGKSLEPLPFTKELLELKTRLEKFWPESFNSVLLNLYRDGNDSMGWHRDNEKGLGPEPTIASISLGAEREFKLRDYRTKKEVVTLRPAHGSLLIMGRQSQQDWEHSLPKAKKIKTPRINLTFRKII